MKLEYIYKPAQFFIITYLITWVAWFVAAYLSHQNGKEKPQMLFMLLGLFGPLIVALVLIYASKNSELIKGFWDRLFFDRIHFGSLITMLLVIPSVFYLATAISLLFGKSIEQFELTKEFSVIKGWRILGLVVPIFLAPVLEELGWRGYGVDSLRSNFSLFSTSMLFALLWALWHLPLFFIKGCYHYQLWNLDTIYVVNFFISILPAAILINWVYYKNSRSIVIAILLHAAINLFSILFKTEQFTKCIVTILLSMVAIIVVLIDKEFFFKKSLNQLVKTELDHLQKQYGFPGVTFAYILPDGTIGVAADGFHDCETKIAMTPHSRMLAASIGKSFVAAVVLQLAKEGQLHLDDPISKWLGDRSWFSRLPNHSTITLHHLLTHSSGLPDHVHMNSFIQLYSQNWEKTDQPLSPESLVAFVLDQPPLFEVGKGWMYTDTGYILLGLVIEAATKNSYYNELEERFLKPLNLNETSPSNQADLPYLAAGYTKEDNSFGLPSKTLNRAGLMAWNPKIEWTGGGLMSTSYDLARWAKFLYEGCAMNVEYLDVLLQGVGIGNEESGLSYGAGVAISEKGPLGLTYGHIGIIPGYTSSMRYYPKYRLACAFQINTDIGVSDHSTQLLSDMERRLAEIIINRQQGNSEK